MSPRRPARLLPVLALLGALLSGGCAAHQPYSPPPDPRPTPVPGPVEPGPVAGALSPEEVASIPLGAAEADVTARFGKPLRVVALVGEPGVRSYVYHGRTQTDPTRTAFFWIKDGKVVNRGVY